VAVAEVAVVEVLDKVTESTVLEGLAVLEL
jgi:hypothetical protein